MGLLSQGKSTVKIILLYTIVLLTSGQLRQIICQYKLEAEDIWNFDEKGFILGLAQKVKVICKRDQKGAQLIQDGNHELVTDIETVSASGRVLPPFIIFKGKTHIAGWFPAVSRDDGTAFAFSPHGWTDIELGQEYLIKIFEPETAKM